MGYGYYRRSRSSSSRRYARQVYRLPSEAELLSSRLAGTDAIVKDYFWSMKSRQLARLLDDYETAYGKPARNYAQNTIRDWQTGQTKMSGQTLKRLFDIVPRHMEFSVKKQIVEKLWAEYTLPLRYTIESDFTASVDDIVRRLRESVEEPHVTIPADLKNDFDWLAGDDVQAMATLLKDVQRCEWAVIENDARNRLPLILEDAHRQQHVQRFEQSYVVGKHTVIIVFQGAKLTLPPPPPPAIVKAIPTLDESPTANAMLLALVAIGLCVATFVFITIARGLAGH